MTLKEEVDAYTTLERFGGRVRGLAVLRDLLTYIPSLKRVLVAERVDVDAIMTRRTYKDWTQEEDDLLMDMVFKGYAVDIISSRLGRTRKAVQERQRHLARKRIGSHREG